MRIFSGIQPTGDKHLGNLIGGFRQYAATQERGEAFFCIVDLHSITVDYDPADLRAAHARPGGDPVRDRSRPGALDGLLPEPRDRARRGGLAALGRDELRAARPDDAVQGEGRPAGVRLGRAVHLPGADGGRHPALPDRHRPDRRRPAAAPRALPRRRGALQRAVRRDVRRPGRASTPRSARGSWTSRSRRRRCRRRAGREQGTVRLLDEPDAIRRKFKTAVTDSGREIRRGARQAGDHEPDRHHGGRDRRAAGGRSRRASRARATATSRRRSARRSSRSSRRSRSATGRCARTRASCAACWRSAPGRRARPPRRRSRRCTSGWASCGRRLATC